MAERGITNELASWVLRINDLCNEKDKEIERLRAALKQVADCYPNVSLGGGLNEPTVWDIAKTTLANTVSHGDKESK